MVFEELAQFENLGLFLLRAITAIVFISSGWSHLAKPGERSKSIEMSKGFTLLLGFSELVGALMVLLGIYIQIGAIILVLVMLGAIYKKIFSWKIKFFGEKSTGWHYDAILLCANLVFLFSGGGTYSLLP